ncbi:hypothetical protein [Henriciella litoralis]|nr:hypothetical protein [Henriciella litoralis]
MKDTRRRKLLKTGAASLSPRAPLVQGQTLLAFGAALAQELGVTTERPDL